MACESEEVPVAETLRDRGNPNEDGKRGVVVTRGQGTNRVREEHVALFHTLAPGVDQQAPSLAEPTAALCRLAAFHHVEGEPECCAGGSFGHPTAEKLVVGPGQEVGALGILAEEKAGHPQSF